MELGEVDPRGAVDAVLDEHWLALNNVGADVEIWLLALPNEK